MTVTEMPGDPRQMLGIVTPDLDQRLGRRYHLDQPVIVEHHRVAASQHGCVLQVEQKLKPARAPHRHPPPVTIVEIEHDGIGRRFGPAILPSHFGRADHISIFRIMP